MDMNTRVFWQEEIERKYSRKHIDGYIREEILANPDMQAKIAHGVQLLEDYRTKTYSYQSKNDRVKQLENLDLEQLVIDIFVGIAYCQTEELFTSVSAMMAGRLKFSDKLDAIKTVAEIMAVLCLTDAFDIVKANKMASLAVLSRIPLSQKLVEFVMNSQYLPPMVCKPKELRSNYDSGYLTHNESLILGSGNHHDGDLCLDVLNTLNAVELKLDTDFLSTVEEDPTTEFTLEKVHESAAKKGKSLSDAEALVILQKQIEHWHRFKPQSYEFYQLMVRMGNRFHLCHKVDKRGRIYATGYHINSMGSSFKRASIELAKEEIIEGVPAEYRL